jgi:hypothetical protein
MEVLDSASCGQFVCGSLFTKQDRTALSYLPVEISRLSLSFLTSREACSRGERLLMTTADREIELLITGVQASREGVVAVSSKVMDPKVSLESALSEVAELKAMGEKLTLRAARIGLVEGLSVKAKTFGSLDSYLFCVGDVSKTGLKLTTRDEDIAPFSLNTVIELQILAVDKKPFSGLGKIVRREPSASGVEFGVRLVDNDERFVTAWSSIVDLCEQQSSEKEHTSARSSQSES